MELFTRNDFKIFELSDFRERMAAIRSRIQPKLASIGGGLSPLVSALVDAPLFVHVAKHMRRTVNPPNDTWAAFSGNPRGYKADVHFKVAVSRHCVRLLFEAGPEYYAKADWARNWANNFSEFSPGLRSSKNLEWFANEHDEDSASLLHALAPADFKKLGRELTRRKDGQLVIGRRIASQEFCALSSKQLERMAEDTFKPIAPLFALHKARVGATTTEHS